MPAHPLATALAGRLWPGAHVLDFGAGRGRNTEALRGAGLTVYAIDDADAMGATALRELDVRLDGVLATHALLHGAPESIALRIGAIADRLDRHGLFFATFASTRDARYGHGERIAENAFAASDGDERGVTHVFFDEASLRALLEPQFLIESLSERSADPIAGTWAHPTAPLQGAVHWLLFAQRAQ